MLISAIGLAAGFLGGLLGVGGGFLMVPAFLFLLKDRIPDMHVAVGTSMAIIVVNAVAATVQHSLGGRVNWQVVGYVAVSAIIGGSLGAYVSGLVEKAMLQRLFAVMLILVALKMFFSTPDAAPRIPSPTTSAVAEKAPPQPRHDPPSPPRVSS